VSALGGIRTPNLLIRRLGGAFSGCLERPASRSEPRFRQSAKWRLTGAVAVSVAVKLGLVAVLQFCDVGSPESAEILQDGLNGGVGSQIRVGVECSLCLLSKFVLTRHVDGCTVTVPPVWPPLWSWVMAHHERDATAGASCPRIEPWCSGCPRCQQSHVCLLPSTSAPRREIRIACRCPVWHETVGDFACGRPVLAGWLAVRMRSSARRGAPPTDSAVKVESTYNCQRPTRRGGCCRFARRGHLGRVVN
jgi:hypothetical protein